MRIACLELERFRRNKERESAMGRVRQLDARFGEIEAEQTAILSKLGQDKAAPGPQRAAGSPVNMQKGAFRLRY
jgi:hypothetical protein